jgi:Uma2 family endonuclease
MALSFPVLKLPDRPHRPNRRYLRPPAPLVFPTGKNVPEGADHKLKLYDLWLSVRHAYADGCLTSSDQFLYYDATNPKKCLAPDFALRLGAPHELLKTWKTWEKGAPHVAVEIVSDWDRSTRRLEETLERYSQAGVAELARLDPENRRRPLRIWDLFEGDMVERDLADPESLRCDALGLYWCVQEDSRLGLVLRLGLTIDCGTLLPTPEEAERAEKEAALAAKEAALADKNAALADRNAALADRNAALADKDSALAAKEAALADKDSALAAREAALARIAELEAELAKKR